ncbi:GGDEF domain-containing protein [Acetobacterium sp.]|uniref:GGDEF domain-containing protein n=1 Tax=Acetobacterium sp. TaxID=1872094 RepID=UPI0027219F73|nr:GGDEF domain-containing protein [Acetobacterium sp.]MDO9493389.1 GGDEF domain-containing protein [Acetobacterium sp.]
MGNTRNFITNVKNDYLVNKKMAGENRVASGIKIGICLLLYLTALFLQIRFASTTNIAGVIAQIQVMVSVYLVVAVRNKGYQIAVGINILVSLIISIRIVFLTGNLDAIPGVVIPFCTIITISIISFYEKSFEIKLTEVTAQKKELSTLYDELAGTEKEILQQNVRLKDLNRKMKQREVRLNYLAYTDVLTGLPNREMLINKLDFLVERAQEKQAHFTVVFIDLDDFKKINDYKGHYIGDLLLKSIADKIKKIVYQQDMLGRLGGDEFTLKIQRDLSEIEIFEYVEKIRTAILEPFVVENMELNISASFGIALYPRDGINAAELLNYSDIAMYKAKEFGKNRVQFINERV